jgi:tetratricopeptide (TPR) repeat protein
MIRVKHETLAIDPKEYVNRGMIAKVYFDVGMPDEAVRWYGRAVETAPEAKREVWRLRLRTDLGVYHQRNDEEVFESLQRRLQEKDFAFFYWPLFVEYGDRLDRLDEVVSTFEELFSELFKDLPAADRKIQDASSDSTSLEALEYTIYMENFASIVGGALLRAGDRQRGEPILRQALEWHDRHSGSELSDLVRHTGITLLLTLGDTEAARDAFRARLNTADRFFYGRLGTRILMQNSPVLAPIRAMSEYPALLEELDRHAAEHRKKLQAMDLPLR